MKLKKIVLDNFKCHGLLEIKVDGGVVISGMNGAGKTSVLEAIMVGLYNRDLFGSAGTDRFIATGKKISTVTLGFDEFTLQRHIKKSSCPLFIDDEEATKGELEQRIPKMDEGLAMLNPMHLLYADDNTKRKLFMGLLPKIDRKKAFIEMYGEENADRFVASSKGSVRDGIQSMTFELKNTENKIVELKFRAKETEHKIEAIEEGLKSLPETDDPSEYVALVERVAQLEKDKQVYEKLEVELQSYKNQVAKIVKNSGFAKDKSLMEQLTDGRQKSEELGGLVRVARERLTGAQDRLRAIEEINDKGECPFCGTKVDSLMVSDSLPDKIVELKGLIEELEQEKTSVDETVSRLAQIKDEVVRIVNALEELKFDMAEFDRLVEKKKSLSVKFVGVENISTQSRVKLETELQLRKNEVTTYKNDIVKLEKKRDTLSSELGVLEEIKVAFGTGGVDAKIIEEQTKYITEAFEKYLSGIEVVSTRPNKSNASFKQVFDVFVNGVEFHSLSYGERLRVSVAMSLVVRDLSKEKFDFMLLDETAILSKKSLEEIEGWVKKEGVVLIMTRLTEDKFSIESR